MRPVNLCLVRVHRSQSCSTRAFYHGLLDSDEQADGALDIRLGYQQDVVDGAPHELGRDASRRLDGNALRQRVAAHGQRLTLDGVEHRRVEQRLHADDLDAGLQRLGGDGHARNQPAAADRNHQRVEIGHSGQHLQRDSALPGNHQRIVVRVDERQTLVLAVHMREGCRILQRIAR